MGELLSTLIGLIPQSVIDSGILYITCLITTGGGFDVCSFGATDAPGGSRMLLAQDPAMRTDILQQTMRDLPESVSDPVPVQVQDTQNNLRRRA